MKRLSRLKRRSALCLTVILSLFLAACGQKEVARSGDTGTGISITSKADSAEAGSPASSAEGSSSENQSSESPSAENTSETAGSDVDTDSTEETSRDADSRDSSIPAMVAQKYFYRLDRL